MATITCSTSQNLNTIAATASAGDTIELSAGVHYLGPIILNPSGGCSQGTSGSPITITSADTSAGNRAIITYPGPWTSDKTCQFVLEDLSYWELDGFDIANFSGAGMIISGKSLDTTGIRLTDIEIRDQDNEAEYDSYSPVGCHAILIGQNPLSPASSTAVMTDVVADDVRLLRTDSKGGDLAANPYNYNENFTVFGRVNGVTVQNCSIRQARMGIAFNCLGGGYYGAYTWHPGQPQNVTFKNNVVEDFVQQAGVGTAFYSDRAGANCIWEENFVINCKMLIAVNHELGWDAGTVETTGTIIRNNYAVLALSGIYGSSACVGMQLGCNTTWEIADITCYGNHIVIRNVGQGDYGSNGISLQRVRKLRFYNNVIYEQSNNQWFGYYTYNASVSINRDDWQFYNNMFYSDVSASRSWSVPGKSATSLSAWQALGFDSGSTYKRPVFVDLAGASEWADLALLNNPGVGSINASFTYSKSALVVDFTDTTEATETIDSWAWDFGDTNTSTSQNPSNTYAAAGSYTVRLTATSDSGPSSSVQVVTVSTGGNDTTGIITVGAAADNVYSNAGGYYQVDDAAGLTIGDQASASTNYDFKAGVRMPIGIAIPSDATITSATLKVRAAWSSGASRPVIRIYAENAALPTAWPSSPYTDFYNRTLTTAYVDWSPSAWVPGTWYTTTDLATVIQELIDDHTGLASGAYVNIHLTDSQSGFQVDNRTAIYSLAGGSPATLQIDWDEPPTDTGILLQKILKQGFHNPLRGRFQK